MTKSDHLTKLIIGYDVSTNLDDGFTFPSFIECGIINSTMDGPYWDKGVIKDLSTTDKLHLLVILNKASLSWRDVDAI